MTTAGDAASAPRETARKPAPAGGRTQARLPAWVLAGAALGIVTGILFGERTAFLQPIGLAYAKLLEIPVYPYLICSLIYGLGRFPAETAGRLFRSSWAVYLFLWGATLATIYLLSQAIPAPPAPSILTPAMVRGQGDIVDLLIPANLFADLGGNVVPAIVIFAVLYALAVQHAPNRQTTLDVIDTILKASLKIWGWVIYAAPLGVFALFASAAGTIEPQALSGLALYVGLFLLGTVLLAFVVLPWVLSAIVPAGYREILAELRPAFVLAAVTTISAVALPFVQRAAERIAERAGITGDESKTLIQTTVSVSYVFAQLGNQFVYLLMLYAGFRYGIAFTPGEQVLLPAMALLSSVGSPSASIDSVVFLGGWLHLPDGLLDLYVEAMTVTRYGQVALSVMGFGFVALAVPLIYHRRMAIRVPRAAAALASGAVLVVAVAVGGTALATVLYPPPSTAAMLARTLDPALAEGLDVVVEPPDAAPAPATPGPTTLQAIQRSGVLRVGYSAQIIPFSYRNAAGDLVGFDIAYAYQLARDLKVKLELVPFAWTDLAQALADHRFDVAMAGAYITGDRLLSMSVSASYYESPMALIVRSERAEDFLSYRDIMAMADLRLAVFDDPVLLPELKRLFPNAEITVLPNYDGLADLPGIDGAIWTLDQAGAWASAHGGFTAVAPSEMGAPLLFAYLMPAGSDGFRRFLDDWLELEAADGFRQAQLDYWLLGLPRSDPKPRWNVLDDVILAGNEG